MDDYFQITALTLLVTTNVTTSTSYILISLAVVVAGSILFGGIGIFFNLLDTLQFISYLKYVNTQFPYNLNTFFDTFNFV